MFVGTKKPLLFRNELVATDRLQEVRAAHDGEIKRMGDEPAVIELVADDAVIQIAVHCQDRDLALGPYSDRHGRAGAGATAPGISDRPWAEQTQAPVASDAPAGTGSD